jgi:hypothetical protein
LAGLASPQKEARGSLKPDICTWVEHDRGRDYDKEKQQERVAKLSGGRTALIRTLKALKDLQGANEDQTVGKLGLA